ncbi:hypothetical protein [Streptomyces sp. W1SF4]|uniref:hypothetical protein n=1 Tax=Streptomyces sp. W1SF4 TaxID=2305220 RepID=UPI000F6EEF95|nr:hypothetical protein [Streptomyces sp. W1SF4]AZM92626.1 hypothetical protein D1J60_32725 [Streptomyces sp. W1SF4]
MPRTSPSRPHSRPPARTGSTARVLDFSRDWAGLCRGGRILVSIDRITHGDPLTEILAHESVHDVLLRTTPLGWTQLVLSPSAMDPYQPGPLRDRCARLLAATVQASRFTQEAVATFLPGLDVAPAGMEAYRARHPQPYLDAADALEWLRTRDLPPQARERLALALGQLALAVPVLEAWQPQRLHRPQRAEQWFRDPRNRPDRRFPVLCRALRELPDGDLLRAARGGADATARLLAHVRVDGEPLAYGRLPDDLPTSEWLDGLVENVIGPLLADTTLPQDDRDVLAGVWALPALTMPGLHPALLSVVLTQTTSTNGRIDLDPPTDELHGYPLVEVLHNALPVRVPGVEPVGREPMWLDEGDTALWFISPWQDQRACHLSPSWLHEWLAELDDDTTLCLRDGGDLAGVLTGDRRLAARRRVVLLQHRTPHQALLVELPVLGLDEERGPVTMMVAHSELDGVAYLMLRPESSSPVLIVPTARVTAERAARELVERRDEVRFRLVTDPEDFYTSRGMLRDVLRVLHNFEARPWPDTLRPAPPAAPREPARRRAEADLDPVVARMERAHKAFGRSPTAERFAELSAAAEAVLAAPSFPHVSLGWRIRLRQDVAGALYGGVLRLHDHDVLRRVVEIQAELVALLPEDSPERPAQERTLALLSLCLRRVTGAAAPEELLLEALLTASATEAATRRPFGPADLRHLGRPPAPRPPGDASWP